MFDSSHKENIKNTREIITPNVGIKKLCVCVCVCVCVCQNIPLRGNKENTKEHPEVGKVILPIQEILLQNYCGIDSREGTKTLKTSFRMPNDVLLQFRFIWFFCSFFYDLHHGW